MLLAQLHWPHPPKKSDEPKKVEADLPDPATEAKALVRKLASDAQIQGIWVNSPDEPDEQLEMSVEVKLDTAAGQLVIADDFGETKMIDLNP